MSLIVKTVASKRCPLCCVVAVSVGLLLSHLRLVHSSDPNFNVICGLGGCKTASRSFPALYFHIYRNHPYIIRKRSALVEATPEVISEPSDAELCQQANTYDLESDDLLGAYTSYLVLYCKLCRLRWKTYHLHTSKIIRISNFAAIIANSV